MLVTTERPDGTVARIVFRNGGFDDAPTLEKLCEKVRGRWQRLAAVAYALLDIFSTYILCATHCFRMVGWVELDSLFCACPLVMCCVLLRTLCSGWLASAVNSKSQTGAAQQLHGLHTPPAD